MAHNLGSLKKTIKSKNDGGLSVKLRYGNQQPDFRYGTKTAWPILSFEAKRKSSKKMRSEKGREMTIINHPAQIFGEMLGQVCHKDLFTNNESRYQESFVLHARHDKFALFYSKLPHNYLRWVATEKDKERYPSSLRKIQLFRSRFFLLRKPEDREAFVELIAKLLWYLCSGKSHVGFCRDYPGNPLRNWVMYVDM